jgi:hypothetical protein
MLITKRWRVEQRKRQRDHTENEQFHSKSLLSICKASNDTSVTTFFGFFLPSIIVGVEVIEAFPTVFIKGQ